MSDGVRCTESGLYGGGGVSHVASARSHASVLRSPLARHDPARMDAAFRGRLVRQEEVFFVFFFIITTTHII